MKQYWDIKSLHPEKILLFRMGDFFEMFHDDAVTAAPILGIALTSRNKKALDETPMCGVPHHSIAGPINKLLHAGHRIAICDQIEDPKLAKGLVKRAVTRILTPGMVYDSETLRADLANYMAAIDSESLALVDTSCGEAFYLKGSSSELQRFLLVLPVVELVVDSIADAPAGAYLLTEFKGDSGDRALPSSARRLMAYCESLGGGERLKMLAPFEERKLQKRLQLSSTVIRHLEIFETYTGDIKGSFFEAIDRTKTSGGKRRLRSQLCFPWTESAEIKNEQERVRVWTQDLFKLKQVRDILGGVGDLERRVGRVATPQCHGRDLLSLAESVTASVAALAIFTAKPEPLVKLAEKIMKTLVDDPPLTVKLGSLIRSKINTDLDECVYLATNAQVLLQEMEARERVETGISSLKIRYNNVFGYYIEITNTHKDKAPARYMRKQTLANAERFCTDELIELEKKVLSAQTRRFEMEYQIFEELRQEVLRHSKELLYLAQQISDLDVVTGLAWLSVEKNYVLPTLGASAVKLKASRHPVVEQVIKRNFIANDIEISEAGCLLLTGPNMAGKSTLMRQVALAAILAQIGGPVPALQAELPIFDAIYTRIGASDQLSAGLSTFMVEMTETAEMLKNATDRSLVILDEVGRGTSTYDGMSLAQSILEYLVFEKKSFIMFATHYHELTSLPEKFPQVHNVHMSVGEKNGEIRFLHTLKRGPAGKSYGIQVAKLAGVPDSVVARANDLLTVHEQVNRQQESSPSTQMSLLDMPQNLLPAHVESLLQNLSTFEVSLATPLEALNQIAQWQKTLS